LADLPDYYAVLGVPPTASRDEIRAAYRRLARRYHPDVNPPEEDDAAANEFMRRLNEAYDVLDNPRQRAAYDRQLWAQAPSSRTETADRPDSSWSPPDDVDWGPQFGGGRWREPKPRSMVYEQSMPGWLESFFIIERQLKERLAPLSTLIGILVPILACSALLILGFWAYDDIRADPDAWQFLTRIVKAAGGVWVLLGVLGVVVMFVLVVWYAIWRSFNS
jgi:hypothetical protein